MNFSLENTIIQCALSPTSATIYPSYKRGTATERLVQSYQDNFKQDRDTNLLSINAARKLRKAINWLAYLSGEKSIFVKNLNKHVKFRLSFITLTLPSTQIHSDQEIKKECLVPFLQWLRDSKKVKKYIWKAEIQKNGNVHFHITLDKFVHYAEVRRQWNKNIDKLGYVKRYTLESNKFNPPSTEVKSVKKVKNIAAYLTAYLTKTKTSKGKKAGAEYNKRVIGGRLWGVSSYLSKIKSLTITEEHEGFSTLLAYLKGNSSSQYNTDFSTTYSIIPDMFNEICDVYLELLGFDWLIDANFDVYDLGLIPGKHNLN